MFVDDTDSPGSEEVNSFSLNTISSNIFEPHTVDISVDHRMMT